MEGEERHASLFLSNFESFPSTLGGRFCFQPSWRVHQQDLDLCVGGRLLLRLLPIPLSTKCLLTVLYKIVFSVDCLVMMMILDFVSVSFDPCTFMMKEHEARVDC